MIPDPPPPGDREAALGIRDDARVVVVTGAGISAESGVATFRDPEGVWQKFDPEEVATPEGFRRDPARVWRFYSERRAQLRDVAPNAGHRALVDLGGRLAAGGGALTLVTQNVNGLHGRAGTEDAICIHGDLLHTRCADPGCARGRLPWPDPDPHPGPLPRCPHCGGLARPAVVWFGEMLDTTLAGRVERALRACSWFLAVGTSGTVWPVAGYVLEARSHGAETVLINLEPAENLHAFARFFRGPSARLLPALLA